MFRVQVTPGSSGSRSQQVFLGQQYAKLVRGLFLKKAKARRNVHRTWPELLGLERREVLSVTLSEFALPVPTNVSSIVSGPDGALWFTDSATNSIGRITTDGTVTNKFPVPIQTNQDNIALLDLTVGPDGALWFIEGLRE